MFFNFFSSFCKKFSVISVVVIAHFLIANFLSFFVVSASEVFLLRDVM